MSPVGLLNKENHISNPARWRFSLEDPFEVSRDLGSLVVTRPAFYKLHNEFQRAATVLSGFDDAHGRTPEERFQTLLQDNAAEEVCMRCGDSGHVLVTCSSGRREKDTTGTQDGGSAVEDPLAEAERLLPTLCYICGQASHAVRQCPRFRACLLCGSLDHQVKDCPMGRRNNGGGGGGNSRGRNSNNRGNQRGRY
eukprot:INCI7235.6.p2 GENE.INCI7235.6~~INCI7235.6.p2  ORF type:complete len:195 (+),score=34.22 INCI7235.6:230-814(+)